MTFEEKVKIAATARKLIALLDRCDDEEFVDEVVNCVMSNDATPIEVENL